MPKKSMKKRVLLDTKTINKVKRSNILANAEDMNEDTNEDMSIKNEPNSTKKKKDDKLQEDKNVKYPCLANSEQNVLTLTKENESGHENIPTKSTIENRKPLLCSMYSDSDSDSEGSLKIKSKGILCSMYSDSESESEESVQKDNIEKKTIIESQSQDIVIDNEFQKNEPDSESEESVQKQNIEKNVVNVLHSQDIDNEFQKNEPDSDSEESVQKENIDKNVIQVLQSVAINNEFQKIESSSESEEAIQKENIEKNVIQVLQSQAINNEYQKIESNSESEESVQKENIEKNVIQVLQSQAINNEFQKIEPNSESEDPVQKENIGKNVLSVSQSQDIDNELKKNEPKEEIDSQSSSHVSSGIEVDHAEHEHDHQIVDNEFKTSSTVTKSNSSETENIFNQESSLSALTDKIIEVENNEQEKAVEYNEQGKAVVNQSCNKLNELSDSCMDPVNKHNTDSISDSCIEPVNQNDTDSIINDEQHFPTEHLLNPNETIEEGTSDSFKPNEDATNNSNSILAEEPCDKSDITSKDTEQLYEEFFKIIEDEDKESTDLGSVIENKLENFFIPNSEDILFRNFSINLSDLESAIGFKPVESLQDFDVSLSEWATLLVSQLSVRDELICKLHTFIEKLVQKGRALEQDVDYQQIKITELQQQIKKKKRKHKHKSCQTTEDDLLNSWKKYYEQSQQEIQENQWPTHYGAKTSVVPSSASQPSSKEESSVVTVDEESENSRKDVNNSICNDKLIYNISAECGKKDASIIENAEGGNMEKKEKIMKTQDSSNNTNQNSSDTENSEEEDTLSQNVTNLICIPNSDVSSSVSNKISNDSNQSLIGKSQDQPTDSKSLSGTVDSSKSGNASWDKTQNIAEQVIAAATQIVEGSGYVYDQETGFYYDHNSGYYYNAENGLYYDSSTGTYFYYDHSTQAYQFHSQVMPENKENLSRKKSKRKIKNIDEKLTEEPTNKKKKCKIKKEENEEKEDGECSESEESLDGLDEESEDDSGEEEEMETEVKGDLHEEETISQSEVPPSVRLMVIESEAKRVTVGALHMVTVDGGTAGRDPSNIVHLKDISISKVHARFRYHSNGPSDHHYFVQDLGSNNGTFVNAIRLSDPRQESQEKELGHGWLLRLGQVTLKCHIHPGSLTCNECEPGLVAQGSSNKKEGSGYKSVKSREKARKKEMKALRKKYALSWAGEPPPLSAEYNDRAGNRRLVVGSDNPYEKTEVASSDVAIPKKNKGFKMLEKMGWTEGEGLGKTTTGLIEPIQPESAAGRSGLGCVVTPVPEPTSQQAKRKKILTITKNRFNKF